jgi:hypothetical protein
MFFEMAVLVRIGPGYSPAYRIQENGKIGTGSSGDNGYREESQALKVH